MKGEDDTNRTAMRISDTLLKSISVAQTLRPIMQPEQRGKRVQRWQNRMERLFARQTY